MDKRSHIGNTLLILMVFYQGPWERLSNWCYGIRKDGALRWTIPEEPEGLKWVLAKLGDWAEDHDRVWRMKYAARRKSPPRRWKRRGA